MSYNTIRPFPAVSKDVQSNFHGAQIVYFGWDKHLMFYAPVCKPLPPEMTFRQVIDKVLPESWSCHPEFSDIDWSEARWLRDGEPFVPVLDKSLVDNGVTHKSVVRLQTPGLNGIGDIGF